MLIIFLSNLTTAFQSLTIPGNIRPDDKSKSYLKIRKCYPKIDSISKLMMGPTETFDEKNVWIRTLSTTNVPVGDMIGIDIAEQSILIVHTKKNKWYALSNRSAYLGIPLEYGMLNDDDTISCPQSQTKFDLESGQVVGEWIPFPPVLKNVLRVVVGNPVDIATYPIRIKSNTIEVLIDVNYAQAYEQKYWKGILDAKGKETGEYY